MKIRRRRKQQSHTDLIEEEENGVVIEANNTGVELEDFPVKKKKVGGEGAGGRDNRECIILCVYILRYGFTRANEKRR